MVSSNLLAQGTMFYLLEKYLAEKEDKAQSKPFPNFFLILEYKVVTLKPINLKMFKDSILFGVKFCLFRSFFAKEILIKNRETWNSHSKHQSFFIQRLIYEYFYEWEIPIWAAASWKMTNVFSSQKSKQNSLNAIEKW